MSTYKPGGKRRSRKRRIEQKASKPPSEFNTLGLRGYYDAGYYYHLDGTRTEIKDFDTRIEMFRELMADDGDPS